MGHMISLPLPAIMHHNALVFALTQLVLIIPIVIMYFHYFVSGYKKLFKLSPSMDSLIAISATASLIYGIVAIVMIIIGMNIKNQELVNQYRSNLYFESAGMILI